jgi:hypothetical protein
MNDCDRIEGLTMLSFGLRLNAPNTSMLPQKLFPLAVKLLEYLLRFLGVLLRFNLRFPQWFIDMNVKQSQDGDNCRYGKHESCQENRVIRRLSVTHGG